MKGDTVEVEWLDAMGDGKESISNIEDKEPKDLLVITYTYGIVYKEDDVAMIIFQENSESCCDYTVIPKSLIVSINKLTREVKNGNRTRKLLGRKKKGKTTR